MTGITIYFSIDQQETIDREPQRTTSAPLPTPKQVQSTMEPKEPLFGEILLQGYGRGDPTGDLRKVESLIANFRILAKGMDARHFASNANLSASLRGEGRIAIIALPEDHSLFNAEGLLTDRWKTPLFFHMEAADKIDIYSAGPDKEMGTEDDYCLIDGVAQQQKAEF